MNLKIREWSRVNDIIPYGLRARKSTNPYLIIEVCVYTVILDHFITRLRILGRPILKVECLGHKESL